MINSAYIKTRLQILLGDVLGGLNSAVVTLPQALAFGVATGFGASAGIWGAIILCFAAGILGTKVPMISGTTGPVTIVIASIMHSLTGDINLVIFIMLLAGIIQMIIALTPFPNIVKYVPYPVISGFMNGVGVIIIIMQLNPLLGKPTLSNTIECVKDLFGGFAAVNTDALLIGAMTLFIVFTFPKKFNKYLPSQIVALVVCTLISIKLGLNVDRISEISVSMPKFHLPTTNLHNFIAYFHYSIILAIVMCSESMLTGLVADSLTKTKTSPKVLLSSQGIGNICCAMTGSMCGVAATMRTVAALNAGATTKIAAIVNPVVLILLLFKFSGFVAQIPLAVLAGILIKIGYDIIDTKLLKVLKLAPKDDLYVLFTVFFLTVFYNLIAAVGAGIVLAALLYAKRVADNAEVIEKNVYDEDIMKLEKILEKDYRHKIRVVHISGHFFFGSATQMISKFDEFLGTKYLIINYDTNDQLDISAIFAFEDIIARLKAQHIKILLVMNGKEALSQLDSHGLIDEIGADNIFADEIDAINFAKDCMKKKIKRRFF